MSARDRFSRSYHYQHYKLKKSNKTYSYQSIEILRSDRSLLKDTRPKGPHSDSLFTKSSRPSRYSPELKEKQLVREKRSGYKNDYFDSQPPEKLAKLKEKGRQSHDSRQRNRINEENMPDKTDSIRREEFNPDSKGSCSGGSGYRRSCSLQKNIHTGRPTHDLDFDERKLNFEGSRLPNPVLIKHCNDLPSQYRPSRRLATDDDSWFNSKEADKYEEYFPKHAGSYGSGIEHTDSVELKNSNSRNFGSEIGLENSLQYQERSEGSRFQNPILMKRCNDLPSQYRSSRRLETDDHSRFNSKETDKYEEYFPKHAGSYGSGIEHLDSVELDKANSRKYDSEIGLENPLLNRETSEGSRFQNPILIKHCNDLPSQYRPSRRLATDDHSRFNSKETDKYEEYFPNHAGTYGSGIEHLDSVELKKSNSRKYGSENDRENTLQYQERCKGSRFQNPILIKNFFDLPSQYRPSRRLETDDDSRINLKETDKYEEYFPKHAVSYGSGIEHLDSVELDKANSRKYDSEIGLENSLLNHETSEGSRFQNPILIKHCNDLPSQYRPSRRLATDDDSRFNSKETDKYEEYFPKHAGSYGSGIEHLDSVELDKANSRKYGSEIGLENSLLNRERSEGSRFQNPILIKHCNDLPSQYRPSRRLETDDDSRFNSKETDKYEEYFPKHAGSYGSGIEHLDSVELDKANSRKYGSEIGLENSLLNRERSEGSRFQNPILIKHCNDLPSRRLETDDDSRFNSKETDKYEEYFPKHAGSYGSGIEHLDSVELDKANSRKYGSEIGLENPLLNRERSEGSRFQNPILIKHCNDLPSQYRPSRRLETDDDSRFNSKEKDKYEEYFPKHAGSYGSGIEHLDSVELNKANSRKYGSENGLENSLQYQERCGPLSSEYNSEQLSHEEMYRTRLKSDNQESPYRSIDNQRNEEYLPDQHPRVFNPSDEHVYERRVIYKSHSDLRSPHILTGAVMSDKRYSSAKSTAGRETLTKFTRNRHGNPDGSCLNDIENQSMGRGVISYKGESEGEEQVPLPKVNLVVPHSAIVNKFKLYPPSAEEMGEIFKGLVIYFPFKINSTIEKSAILSITESFKESAQFDNLQVDDAYHNEYTHLRYSTIRWHGMMLARGLSEAEDRSGLSEMKTCSESRNLAAMELINKLAQTCYSLKEKPEYFHSDNIKKLIKVKKIPGIFRLVRDEEAPNLETASRFIENFFKDNNDCELMFHCHERMLIGLERYARCKGYHSRCTEPYLFVSVRRTPQYWCDKMLARGLLEDYRYQLIPPQGARNDIFQNSNIKSPGQEEKKKTKVHPLLWESLQAKRYGQRVEDHLIPLANLVTHAFRVKQQQRQERHEQLWKQLRGRVKRVANKVKKKMQTPTQNEAPNQELMKTQTQNQGRLQSQNQMLNQAPVISKPPQPRKIQLPPSVKKPIYKNKKNYARLRRSYYQINRAMGRGKKLSRTLTDSYFQEKG